MIGERMMDTNGWTVLLGLVAAACTTVSFVPQVVKTVKTKHTEDISLLMYVVLTLGLFLWLLYGLLLRNIPLVAANSLSCSFSAIILYLKIRLR